ncbi:MAG: ABC transporter substrate binding protein [bacterium]|nr:ABC transporter substrate binding protein [bacterium]
MKKLLIAFALLAAAGVGGYAWWQNGGGNGEKALVPAAGTYAGKKIMYIDSYHAGYDWSDGITKGVKSVLDPSGVDLEIVRMDTKNNPSEEFKLAAGAAARDAIEAFRPDVLLVSDDNAFKYVVQAYYKDAALPIVFSGLNWDASLYGAPYSNTTGMIEVSLTNQIIDHLKNYAKGTRVGYLSADTETERKNLTYYGTLLNITFSRSYFAKTMAEWKAQFTKLQNEVDLIIFENNAGITDWNEADAEAYALANTKVPVGTTNPWIMPYALLGITKIPDEQGEWQAETALKILDGASPSSIPLVKNKRGQLMANLKLAGKLKVTFPSSILKNAEVVQ